MLWKDRKNTFFLIVREAEGGETTPSFGHPSYVRRGKGGTAFGAKRSEVPKGYPS